MRRGIGELYIVQCSSGVFDAGQAFTVGLLFWGMERAVREFGFAVRSVEAHLLVVPSGNEEGSGVAA
jgi:hypothetical protein